MKRKAFMMLIMACIVSLLSGCGGGNTSANKANSSAAQTVEENKTSVAVNDKKTPSSSSVAQEPKGMIATDLTEEWVKHPLECGAQILDCYFYSGEPVEEAIETLKKSAYKWEYDYNPDKKIWGQDSLMVKNEGIVFYLSLKGPKDTKHKDAVVSAVEFSGSDKYPEKFKLYNISLDDYNNHNQTFEELATFVKDSLKDAEVKLMEKQTSTEGQLLVLYKVTYSVPNGTYQYLENINSQGASDGLISAETDKLCRLCRFIVKRNVKDKSVIVEDHTDGRSFPGDVSVAKMVEHEKGIKSRVLTAKLYEGFDDYKK